jgi:phosphoserine aminotransferase
MARVHNFCAGPAALPEAVLERAAAELLDWHGSGMSFMEMSHRSKAVVDVVAEAEASLRRLLRIGDEFAVLFVQGGASAQFAAVPLNLGAQLDGLRLPQHRAVVAQGHEGSLALR